MASRSKPNETGCLVRRLTTFRDAETTGFRYHEKFGFGLAVGQVLL